VKKRLNKTSNRKYRPSENQKPDPTVTRANKRLASRFYQLKTGHCLTGPIPPLGQMPCAGGASIRSRLASTNVQELPAMEKPAEKPLGNRPGGDQEASGRNPGERAHKIAELFADERCS